MRRGKLGNHLTISLIILMCYTSPAKSVLMASPAITTMDALPTTITTTTIATIPQAATLTLTSSASSVSSDICEDNGNNNSVANFMIESITGDVIVSLITKGDPSTALFVTNRINEYSNYNLTIGIRVLIVKDINEISDILLGEIRYLTECEMNGIGIFMTHELYGLVKATVDDTAYNVWQLPSIDDIIHSKAVHILYELPWDNPNTSIEIRANSLTTYNHFMDAAKREKICFKHYPTNDESIYIVVGNEIIRATNFGIDETVIAIPSTIDKLLIAELPNNSFILMESHITTKDDRYNESEDNKDSGIIPSELFIMGKVLLDIHKWVEDIVSVNCHIDDGNKINLTNCPDSIQDWRQVESFRTHQQIIEELNLSDITETIHYDMFQKIRFRANDNNTTNDLIELRKIASLNYATNVTTFYHYRSSSGNGGNNQTMTKRKFGHIFHCTKETNEVGGRPMIIDEPALMYWRIRPKAWVAVGLTTSILGVLICLSIMAFVVIRICMEDVLEGNPLCTILLLFSLITLFASFIPFSMEYVGTHRDIQYSVETITIWNTLCALRIFIITFCYCITFSLLLCRAIMLASIGSEGGFLSHVNGYLQSIICAFSTMVQLGLSTQLLIVMHAANKTISCESIFYGCWFWGLLAYDGLLLLLLVILSPLIFRSQRNYKEGALLVTGGILCLLVWMTWIPLSTLGNEWRTAAVPLGAQASGWAILGGILIPRCFLIVRGIARSDLVQALPSLTSLAFAQNNQYSSEQSIYECVNPAMRQRIPQDESFPITATTDYDRVPSPSEIPTLPLRSARRNNNNHISYIHSHDHDHTELPPTPSKVTRF